MAKQVVTSDQLYPVYGPYSHAVRAGDMIFLHGTVGFDPQGRLPGDTPGRADMVRQCEQTIANMATALQLLGGSLQDVVKVRAFLPQHCRPARAGQQSFDETFDEVYGRHFQPPRPARAALQQGLFQEDLLVEIEAIAIVNQAKTPHCLRCPAPTASPVRPGRHSGGESPLPARLHIAGPAWRPGGTRRYARPDHPDLCQYGHHIARSRWLAG